ncbi:MAG: malto-oligosyltrehalose trehalohydrolase [Gemmatimonadota bacterium]
MRRYPAGAEVSDRGVHFRVWAPECKRVALLLDGSREPLRLESEADGYFALLTDAAGPGTQYRFLLDRRGPFPDPASRFQPEGPHGPSQVIDPDYTWTDAVWPGPARTGQIIYELHIGTFTHEGTWAAAADRLGDLAELGITVIEVMPVAEFAGRFGWGYDGVGLYAPTQLYGRPDDFRAFVNRAHALGLAVILDVVYNHLGPDGNYLAEFAPAYFSSKYKNEWGEAVNFDGEHAGPVRDFFAGNAGYWVDEFHLDGLRLDATQQIFDASPCNILHEIRRRVAAAGGERATYVIAENERQDTKLLRAYGIDAIWNEDFHHAAHVALTGHREAYYSDFTGSAQELVSCIKHGFLFQGQRSAWQGIPRGTPTRGLSRDRFIHYLENHDQVANQLRGLRLHQLTSPGKLRALTALLLLAPQTPALFQGQELGAVTPFLYFADHKPELAMAVARGRAQFMSQFPSIGATLEQLPLPNDPAAFAACKLDRRTAQPQILALHRDLIALRRNDPVFARMHELDIDGAVLAPEAFVLRYFDDASDRLLIINLGRDIDAAGLAEPLLGLPDRMRWHILWGSEAAAYDGGGIVEPETNERWHLQGESALVLEAVPT